MTLITFTSLISKAAQASSDVVEMKLMFMALKCFLTYHKMIQSATSYKKLPAKYLL